jgi:hypothetical protein
VGGVAVLGREVIRGMSGSWAARALLIHLACAVVIMGGSHSFLHAQEIRFRHQAGLYLPTKFSIQDGVLHVQQKVGLKVGAALTFVFNNRFNVIAGATYIPGYAVLHGAGKQFKVAAASHLFSVSTGARYWVVPQERRFSMAVQTGLGVSAGGQTAYEDLFERSILSGSIGAVLRYQIGQILRLQLGINERLYRLRLGGGDPGRAGKPFRVVLGLAFPFLESGSQGSDGWR